ncbi:MAG: transcription elongation factor GreA [Clostridiales bacterium]|nr:transcription elongation factor GreA [Clostridiales bacterium]MCD8214180.1 transcription elongation factor GreA [Clostridiales bacterium]
MAETKTIILTSEGKLKLEEELQHLKVVRRAEVAVKIKEARAQGDLSENAEYDAAKEEQAEIESRITQIQNMLKKAEIINEDAFDKGVVNLGNKVKIYDNDFEEEDVYTIVGSAEADPMKGKISNESPIGRALLGHKPGDEVPVETPDGIITIKVLEIL